MYNYVDLYLQATIDGQIDEVPADLMLPLELHLMDAIAIKTAGNEQLVHWEASEELH